MRFECSAPLTSRERYLMALLEREYDDEIARTVLRPLLTQHSPVSLRTIDWCVTNWAKQHNVVCAAHGTGNPTNIHHSYRSMLNFWKRRLFDPFRRRTRCTVLIDGTRHETTLGQANFALFIYRSGILSYVLGHVDEIERDMNAVSQSQKRKRREALHQGVRRQRKELTSTPRSMCVAYMAPIHVTFSPPSSQ